MAAHIPYRLARYFDDLKSPMCFHCKKWGNLSKDCPENVVYSVEEVFNNDCYIIGVLDVESKKTMNQLWE